MPPKAPHQHPVTVDEVYRTIHKDGIEHAVGKGFDVTRVEDDRLRELCLQAKRVNAQILDRIESLMSDRKGGFPGWW